MRILIVSDTHRRNENYFEVLEKKGPFDRVIHCGDVEGSEYVISTRPGCPVDMVAGNNDFFTELPRELETRIGKYKVLVTHGHNYYVSMNTSILSQEAAARGMDVVMYGHTHKPVVEKENGVWVINPGSLAYPRQEGRRPSYIIMELKENQEPEFQIYYL